MSDIWVLYSTFPNRAEALSVARALVEKRLVACANLYDGVTSIYRWEGGIQEEPEVVLMAKSHSSVLAQAIDMVQSLHPYEVPCITAFQVGQGAPAFLRWVEGEVVQQPGATPA